MTGAGIVKIINNQEILLTVEEKDAVACFKRPADIPEEKGQVADVGSLAATAMKRRHDEMQAQSKNHSAYIDLTYIPATSVVAESGLSTAKYVLSDHRRSMSPQLFNAIVFLKLNRRFWNEDVFHLASKDAVPADQDDDDDEEYMMPAFPDEKDDEVEVANEYQDED